MRIEDVELRRVDMPLAHAFQTSFGTQTKREVLIVRVTTEAAEGWGECVALSSPIYSSEFTAAAEEVTARFFVPELRRRPLDSAEDVSVRLSGFRGNRMAKAALEMAILDAELRENDISLGLYLGAQSDRVTSGVSIGIMPSIAMLLASVEGYLGEGYGRIKLKIQPGWDIEPVRAVRQRFGPDVLLQVDANAAYARSDQGHLGQLDEFGLLLIEQPLDEEDLLGHAQLARSIATPICLDESIVSVRTAVDAIELGACSIVNIKPGRVGGYLEARRVHDVCLELGVPVWCGGMLETGLGRAANIALAALPGFTLPGDLSASSRFFSEDLTTPFELSDGALLVPTGPGVGVSPIPGMLERRTITVRRC